MPSVSIAVATYRRPDELAQLLDSIAQLSPLDPPWTVHQPIVVDNDPSGTAQPVCGGDVLYAIEPEPGISASRNRAISMARSQGSDFVAFVDDDQTVSKEWLAELSRVQSRHDADAVIGAVDYHHPDGTPEWYRAARIFETQLVDGSQPDGYFSTNNCLVRIQPPPVDLPLFDPRFGLTGGSDHLLGARLRDSGRSIAYAPEATAHERVLQSRVNRSYAIERLIRKGNTLALVDVAMAESASGHPLLVRARHTATGVARIGYGILKAAVGLPQGRQGAAAGLRTSFIGWGQILGAFDVSIREYAGRHSSA